MVSVSTFFGFSKVTVSVSVFGRSVSVLVSTFFGFSKVSVSVFFQLFSVLVSVFLHQIFYKNGRFVQNLNKYYGLKVQCDEDSNRGNFFKNSAK